jgi:cytochrome c oxidase cbb3-type subunit III
MCSLFLNCAKSNQPDTVGALLPGIKPLRVVILVGLIAGCDDTASPPAESAPREPLTISLVEIAPGPAEPVHEKSEIGRTYAEDPEQIAAGRQIYLAFNCVGCHFNGGGGIGPPLMDDEWIYGGSVENIAASILQGRPNGMPSFRAIVVGNQVWQLAAYVQSLSAEAKPADQEGATEPSKFERRSD